MSKMSQLAMELDEQAVELGFRDRDDAMNNGYEIIGDGKFAHLVKTEDEMDEAHKAWLKDREELLNEMDNTIRVLERHNYFHDADVVKRAEEFIMKGEV